MNANEYHLITFDPGAAATGWTWLCVDFHAFSRPEADLWQNVLWWDCGEFRGAETAHLEQATGLITECLAGYASFLTMAVVTEDFELTQMIGSKENLLSPVRINAVLSWECYRRGIRLKYQSRSLRTNINRQRLAAFGFEGKFRKDEFAAMQHAVVWLRRLKKESRKRPWKLSEDSQLNAYWDCACSTALRDDGRPKSCDMWHPS